jgi:hypothetical protein
VSSDELTLESVAEELDAVTKSGASLDKSKTDEADLTLGRLFRAVQKFNYLTQIQMNAKANLKPLDTGTMVPQPGDSLSILDDFDTWVQKIKQALSQIAKFLGAAQYSIGVQFPFAISVSITFNP